MESSTSQDFSDPFSSFELNTSDNLPFSQIGPKNLYFRWKPEYHDKFVEWWLSTQWAVQAVANQSIDLVKQLNWESQNRKSIAWKQFDQGIHRITGEPKVICQNCNKVLAHPNTRNTGTKALSSHIASRQCLVYSSQSNTRQRKVEDMFHAISQPIFTKQAFHDQVLATIVSLRTSFRAVENPEWRKLAVMQNPNFELPSATTMKNRLMEQSVKLEQNMLSNVVPGSKIAISLDCWSSTTRLSFMGIIAHYIDKSWVLCQELIGFESLVGVHSGNALAQVINNVFQQHNLFDRVVSITTDNASSNTTMVLEINGYLQEALKANSILKKKVQHVPCLSHVIQLSLQALLSFVQLRPTNETFVRNWVAEKELSDLEKIKASNKRGIPYILAKIRKLAILVNSSAQRKHRFQRVQQEQIRDSSSPNDPVLTLLIDVCTRWDSTVHMILRALRLKESINQFCSAYDPAKPFSFSALEWKKIGYLADLLRPFNFFTTTIGKTTSVTLPYALSIYDELFEHLQESRRVLTKKSVAQLWVKDLIGAINAAEAKLDTYYNKTYSSLGSLYGIGAILDPKSKLKSFEEDYCWLNFKTVDWAKEFERQFRSLYDTEYKEKSTNADRLSQIREVNHDPLALALSRKRFTRDIQNPYRKDDDFSLSEVDEWLAMKPDNRSPLLVWKSLETQLPGLSAMARDLLCIPMAGVGVERAFSFARDICGYRRGQLQPTTIRSLLLVYHSLVEHSRTRELQNILFSTIDIQDMTLEDMETEIRTREKDLEIQLDQIDLWENHDYISDEEPEGNEEIRTRRAQERWDYKISKSLRQSIHQNQPLSTIQSQNTLRNRREPSIETTNWELSSNSSQELPRLPTPDIGDIVPDTPIGIHRSKRQKRD